MANSRVEFLRNTFLKGQGQLGGVAVLAGTVAEIKNARTNEGKPFVTLQVPAFVLQGTGEEDSTLSLETVQVDPAVLALTAKAPSTIDALPPLRFPEMAVVQGQGSTPCLVLAGSIATPKTMRLQAPGTREGDGKSTAMQPHVLLTVPAYRLATTGAKDPVADVETLLVDWDLVERAA